MADCRPVWSISDSCPNNVCFAALTDYVQVQTRTRKKKIQSMHRYNFAAILMSVYLLYGSDTMTSFSVLQPSISRRIQRERVGNFGTTLQPNFSLLLYILYLSLLLHVHTSVMAYTLHQYQSFGHACTFRTPTIADIVYGIYL